MPVDAVRCSLPGSPIDSELILTPALQGGSSANRCCSPAAQSLPSGSSFTVSDGCTRFPAEKHRGCLQGVGLPLRARHGSLGVPRLGRLRRDASTGA